MYTHQVAIPDLGGVRISVDETASEETEFVVDSLESREVIIEWLGTPTTILNWEPSDRALRRMKINNKIKKTI